VPLKFSIKKLNSKPFPRTNKYSICCKKYILLLKKKKYEV